MYLPGWVGVLVVMCGSSRVGVLVVMCGSSRVGVLVLI